MGRFSDFDMMVAEFMSEFGFSTKLLRTTHSVPNDADGTISNITTEIPIRAIRSELFRPLNGSGTKAGTAIQEGDLILYVQPTEKADSLADALVVNATSDKILINGVAWNIVTSKLHAPDPSDAILYELYIRK